MDWSSIAAARRRPRHEENQAMKKINQQPRFAGFAGLIEGFFLQIFS
jgi:hypothetical protein